MACPRPTPPNCQSQRMESSRTAAAEPHACHGTEGQVHWFISVNGHFPHSHNYKEDDRWQGSYQRRPLRLICDQSAERPLQEIPQKTKMSKKSSYLLWHLTAWQHDKIFIFKIVIFISVCQIERSKKKKKPLYVKEGNFGCTLIASSDLYSNDVLGFNTVLLIWQTDVEMAAWTWRKSENSL